MESLAASPMAQITNRLTTAFVIFLVLLLGDALQRRWRGVASFRGWFFIFASFFYVMGCVVLTNLAPDVDPLMGFGFALQSLGAFCFSDPLDDGRTFSHPTSWSAVRSSGGRGPVEPFMRLALPGTGQYQWACVRVQRRCNSGSSFRLPAPRAVDQRTNITMPRPRTRSAEQRRGDLMDAALRRFLEKGVGPTTIEDITSAADVAKGTFYLYFSSKEQILAALGDRFARNLLTRIQAAIAENAEGDWKGKLAAWARAGVSGYLDSIREHDILFYGSRPPTREGLIDNIVIDHLLVLLREGVGAGAWTVDDPRLTAVFLFSGLHGAVDDAYCKEKRINRSRLTARLEHLCLRAVGLSED